MAKNIFIRSKSFRNALQRASKIASDKKRLSSLLAKTREKVKSIDDEKGVFHKMFGKIFTFIRMIRAYITGSYKDIPLKTIIIIVAALIYFVVPVDFIPDFIPGIGLVDDASIILAVYKSISMEVSKFEEFEKNNQ